MGFSGGSDGNESACDAEDPSWIPGWGRSPGEGHGNPFQDCVKHDSYGSHVLGCSSPLKGASQLSLGWIEVQKRVDLGRDLNNILFCRFNSFIEVQLQCYIVITANEYCIVIFLEDNLQCYVRFKSTAKWFSYACMHILSQFLFQCRSLHDIGWGSLCYTVGPSCYLFVYSSVCINPKLIVINLCQ